MIKSAYSFLFILLFTSISLNRAQDPQDTETSASSAPSVAQSLDLKVIPGTTKQLQINLKGTNEDLSFKFQADKTDRTGYEIQVLINQKVDSTQLVYFLQPETLALTLDYQNKVVIITGDHGFLIKSPIEELNYELNVLNEKIPEGSFKGQAFSSAEATNKERALSIGLSVGGGICVVLVLAMGLKVVLRNRRSRTTVRELPTKCPNSAESINKEVQGIKSVEVKPCEEGVNQADVTNPKVYAESLVIGSKTDFDKGKDERKKQGPPSQVSTSPTLTLVSSQNSLKSAIIVPDVVGAKTTTNIEKVEGKKQVMSLNDVESTMNKAKIEKMKKQKEEQNRCREHKEFKLSFDFECTPDVIKRRGPTEREIRALVKKMEAEGLIGQDCDPSAESDDEDQYEAPELPNYFCCMLCFQGNRSMLVHPCRHIFACGECMEEMLASYKICLLCANQITGYEPL